MQAQVLNLLAELKERHGLTYLFISHDLDVVRNVSGRIAVMFRGQIVELGGAEEVFSRPRHPYTLALLAAMPRADRREDLVDALADRAPDLLRPEVSEGCVTAIAARWRATGARKRAPRLNKRRSGS